MSSMPMKLAILMATYDRFIPYIKSIRSIKPAIKRGSNIFLVIRVDSKLSNFKFVLKMIITRIILGLTQYSYDWGSDCIGKSRDSMIMNTDCDYFLNFDDDDELNASNLKSLASILRSSIEIYNFDYYPRNKKVDTIIYEKGSWKPRLWFRKGDTGICIGQSSIFKKSLYLYLTKNVRYNRKYIDDMLPNHIMYLEAKRILYVTFEVVKRCRGENSLMNSYSFEKFSDLIESLDEFKSYLDQLVKKKSLTEHRAQLMWKVTLSNQLTYHHKKSGDEFFKIAHRIFNYEDLW